MMKRKHGKTRGKKTREKENIVLETVNVCM